MWKQRANELQKWLGTKCQSCQGAKRFLQIRYGVRSAAPFVPAHAFGLAFDETNGGPVSVGEGPLSHGGGNQTRY